MALVEQQREPVLGRERESPGRAAQHDLPHQRARLTLLQQRGRHHGAVVLHDPHGAPGELDFPGKRVAPPEAKAHVAIARRGRVAPLHDERQRTGQAEVERRQREDATGDHVDWIAGGGATRAAVDRVGASTGPLPISATVGPLAAAVRVVAAMASAPALTVSIPAASPAALATTAASTAHDEDARVHSRDRRDVRDRSRARHSGMVPSDSHPCQDENSGAQTLPGKPARDAEASPNGTRARVDSSGCSMQCRGRLRR